MAPKISKIEPRWRPRAPKWSQNVAKLGSRRRKNHEKKLRQKKRGDFTALPLLSRKSGQHGSKLAPKMEPRWQKNRSQNRSFFRCLLESIFGWILVDFGCQNGPKLAPKWDQKTISTLKAENQLNASRLAFSWLWGVEVRSKNL